jgi:hypothetical protein
MLPYLAGREQAVLRSEEARKLLLPPQVAFFASCLNAKIYGTTPDDDFDITRAFALNYLYGGAVAVGGSTGISYSNVGQDRKVIFSTLTGNPQWDCNNAWFAFFWDGILNHEDIHGAVGKALQWAENRYINNPNHNFRVSPLEKCSSSEHAVHWKEISEFVLYGDPAFRPYPTRPGANSYDPWHNGEEDK